MPKAGRVCTKCTKRLTSPCDGADKSCIYIKTKPRNLRWYHYLNPFLWK